MDAVVYGADVVDLPHLILLPVIDGLNDLVQVAPELCAVLVVAPTYEKALILERQLGQVRGGGMLVECTLSLRLPHPQILRPTTPTNLLPRPQTILFEVIIKILFGPKMLNFVVMRLTEVVKVLFFVINRVKTLHELTPDTHNAAAATMPIRLMPPHSLILW